MPKEPKLVGLLRRVGELTTAEKQIKQQLVEAKADAYIALEKSGGDKFGTKELGTLTVVNKAEIILLPEGVKRMTAAEQTIVAANEALERAMKASPEVVAALEAVESCKAAKEKLRAEAVELGLAKQQPVFSHILWSKPKK